MSEPAKRLFYALWPDGSTREALQLWQRQCVPQQARKTHRDDLHLTLNFLGNVPSEHIDDLKVLGANQRMDAFHLELDHLGCFARPKVLWAGLKRCPQPLLDLHEDVAEGLRALEFEPDARPYRPHVTLARKVVECPQGVDLKPINWLVSKWGLIESRPGRRPLYKPLAIWPLDEK
jgi:2'-5' RNA ligase